jgi:hypothetical protein
VATDQADLFRVARRTDGPQSLRLCALMFALALVLGVCTVVVADRVWPSICISLVFALAGAVHLLGIVVPVESELVVDPRHIHWGRLGRPPTVLQRAEVDEIILASNASCILRCGDEAAVGIPDEFVATEAETLAREIARLWPEVSVRDRRKQQQHQG